MTLTDARAIYQRFMMCGDQAAIGGDHREALKMYGNACDFASKNLGQSPEVGFANYSLAVVQLSNGEFVKSLASARMALDVFISLFSEEHLSAKMVVNHMAEVESAIRRHGATVYNWNAAD